MPFCSARRRAAGSGRALKPIMIALDAVARLTSDSVIAPVPLWIVLQLHLGMLGVDLLQRVLDRADRARYIRLQQDIEILDLPGLDLGVQIVKPDRLLGPAMLSA